MYWLRNYYLQETRMIEVLKAGGVGEESRTAMFAAGKKDGFLTAMTRDELTTMLDVLDREIREAGDDEAVKLEVARLRIKVDGAFSTKVFYPERDAVRAVLYSQKDLREVHDDPWLSTTLTCDLLVAIGERFEGERPLHRIAAEDPDEVMEDAKAELLERRNATRLDLARPVAERVADWIGGWSVERMTVILDAVVDVLDELQDAAVGSPSSQPEQEPA